MSDAFYDEDDPFFAVCDRLDAGDKPQAVYDWAKKCRSACKDALMREQWDEALRYIKEEHPTAVR